MLNKIKNILIISISCGLLFGCATVNENPNFAKTNTQTNFQEANSNVYLKAKDSKINARIVTTWKDAPQGTIYLEWVAPKETNCYTTSFPLNKMKENKDVSTASLVAKDSNGKVCAGDWQVNIIDKANGVTIGSSTIKIANN